MISTEQELQVLEQQRQQSAAKVRSLLEQLEQAEKEFAAITEKVKAFRDRVPGPRIAPSAAPIKPPSYRAASTPRA